MEVTHDKFSLIVYVLLTAHAARFVVSRDYFFFFGGGGGGFANQPTVDNWVVSRGRVCGCGCWL